MSSAGGTVGTAVGATAPAPRASTAFHSPSRVTDAGYAGGSTRFPDLHSAYHYEK